MSSPELRHVEDIVDNENVPIVNSAEFDVSMRKSLEAEKRKAELERDALRAGGEAKLKEAEAIAPPPDAHGKEFVGPYEAYNETLGDAETLLNSSAVADERAFKAEQDLKRTIKMSRAHVDENLPEYVEAATLLANEDLKKRLGHKVIVTSKTDGIVSFKNVELVDPAKK